MNHHVLSVKSFSKKNPDQIVHYKIVDKAKYELLEEKHP